MDSLYTGTDRILRLNLLEMLFQRHLPYEEDNTPFLIAGREITLYRIRVPAGHMASAVDLLDELTRRSARG